MDATSPRWRQVTPSQHAWEAEALETLRRLLPDADPYQVWSNFEFTDGGRIHEADALVVTPKGVFLVEIKSWSGQVFATQGTWLQIRRDGTKESYRSPASLNTSKVRSLASLIRRNWRGTTSPPFISSLVWFSNSGVRLEVPTELRSQIAVADDHPQRQQLQTISEAILETGDTGVRQRDFRPVTADQSKDFAATMARIGFKESTRTRTAGSYELQLPAFAERGSTQDFFAKHKLHNLPARVRIYSNVVDASPEEAKALKDAATREFLATRNLPIEGVIHAIDSDVTDFGPAVIFEHHPNSVRLDQFIDEHLDDLDTLARLRIVEQLAATVGEMHRRRITHRMLTPESVWLRRVHATGSDEPEWRPLVTDFSLAAREQTASATVATYTRVGSLPAARTGAVEVVLADPSMETFLAPEATTDPTGADGVALDVFSIGALTYLLVTGRPPAESREQMRTALAGGGLSVSAAEPDVHPTIETFVRACTNPIVSDRLGTMSEVADALAVACAELTGDTTDGEVDPLVAGEGDTLCDGRFVVRRRLGKGSTAAALWCHDTAHDRPVVLKVALGDRSDERLAAEADSLRELKHANVVELHEDLTIAGRRTLVLSFAGERSLASYLRAEGPVSTEYLRRWGEDLLEAVRYLEKVGVAHRDIKPDNLGIVEMGRHKQLHLVLFDFSLADAPASDLLAGTPPYLDPFLGDEGRGSFDLAAERYAAAVTLHEMATGEPPVWGDGQSDPAFLPDDTEPTVLVEAIDPEVREPLGDFLRQALRRKPDDRFDTADDMARAWIAAFAGWEGAGDSDDTETPGRSGTDSTGLPASLSLDDPIGSLSTTRKIRSALRKLGADTVRDVAAVDPVEVNQTRGVSVKTRKAVLRLRAEVLERFADELAAAKDPTTRRTGDAAANHRKKAQPEGPPAARAEHERSTGANLPDLDELAIHLVPPRGKRGPAGAVTPTVRALLGLDELPDSEEDWPAAATVARHVGVSASAVSNSLQKARAHWTSSPELAAVAADVLELLAERGGVAGVSELVDPLVERRGSGHDRDTAQRLARGVLRAVVESAPSHWFIQRRHGRRTLLAVNGDAIADSGSEQTALARLDPPARHLLARFNAAALLDMAVALGDRANALVDATTPLVASSDAIEALRSAAGDRASELSDSRLVRLAAAASDHTVVNAASDLVYSAAPVVAALRWSRPALVGSPRLTIEELGARVSSRFPTVRLPERPALDEAIAAARLAYEWSEAYGAYVTTASMPGDVGPLTIVSPRAETVRSRGGTTVMPSVPTAPEISEAAEIDERLVRSREQGGFLALRVPIDQLQNARRSLARFQSDTPSMTYVDLEAVFLAHLRRIAEQRGIAWRNLEGADDQNDPNWHRLSIVAGDAVTATIDDVARQQRVIAWFPGVLTRHAPVGQTAPIDRLRDATMSPESPLHTLWLVVLGDATGALPTVDGTPVPALAASQWMDLPRAWLENSHRGGELTA